MPPRISLQKKTTKKKSTRKASKNTSPSNVISIKGELSAADTKSDAASMITTINNGIQDTFQKLLAQLPHETRIKIAGKIKEHGPAAAIIVIEKMRRKTKNPKLKLAFKATIMLLGIWKTSKN